MEEQQRKITELEMENQVLKARLESASAGRSPLKQIYEKPEANGLSDMHSNGYAGAQTENASNIAQEAEAKTAFGGLDGIRDLLRYLKTALGYSIHQEANRITLRSIYAFCEEDVFELEICSGSIIFKHTEYLNEWEDYINLYIRNGKSYAAFFAAVTLELFNRRTFG